MPDRLSSPKIAFLDVDGTILDHGRQIAPSTVRAVHEARAAGHLVYLCTGRAAGHIPEAVLDIGFDGAVTNGGAFADAGGVRVHEETMPSTELDALIAHFKKHDLHYMLQSDKRVYAPATTRAAIKQHLAAAQVGKVEPQTSPQGGFSAEPIEEAPLAEIAKAVFFTEEAGAVERAKAEFGDRFHIVRGSMPLPGGSDGEVGLPGTTKGAAIEKVLDHLGLDRADAIGIGDSWNDVEMFDVCGVGIAMGNADPELQKLADEVTTPVLEDGIYNAFARHGLVT
ncbi:Cof-type HAD-IIB family hydrolase [Pseudoclavibacter sp. AY1F1]|uniref:Cof-type HAD-IIB family hydrolase n=1 Tax=Pseudoclavibacter sp. AY1F1 TaxID=2080583 RepID=UPI000CE8F8AE|nr:Cof-type HAD-IIB family hydrolase [Pseudoclavibacter sp. AY1F1]PPF41793.1 Cof-type HAD-IIB family hydrolase [Pseudoclavibacter sp. AY1F1]